MKPKFYFNRFVFSIFATHLIVYLCWSFIEFSLLKPYQEVLATEDSRAWFVIWFFLCFNLFSTFLPSF